MANRFIISALFLLALALAAPAQLMDDFSDGDFTNNPQWLGDVGKFAVSNGELQLMDGTPEANNTTSLYLPAPTASNAATTWEFYVRLDFSPSTSNFARVYLSASSPALAGDQQGYYIRVGGISGSGDALELYRQDGASSALLISGPAGALGGDTAIARVRVERNTAGEWALWAAYTAGNELQLQGTATDNTYTMGAFFGFYCRYTSTRNEDFFFDDIRIGPLFTDQEPPRLLDAEAISATEVQVRFDEPLDSVSASSPGLFAIDNGIGQPSSAALLPGGPSQVLLTLASPMQNTQSYQLTATGLSDRNGNSAGAQSFTFRYLDIQPAAFEDIVISELLPDPSPSQGLPDAEYIELYNRSDKVIRLSTLYFSTGDTPRALPDSLLLPGAYLSLCDDAFETALEAFGPAASLATFPALGNSADELMITDDEGNLIFHLSYDDSWYRDDAKSDGGYSLELIQPDGPYGCPGNWRASRAAPGGSPGQPNSWLGETADNTPPTLLNAIAESEFEIRLTFSEPMDTASAASASNYILEPAAEIAEALLQPGGREVILLLEGALSPGIAYQLSLAGNLADCMGNGFGGNTQILLGLAEPMEPGDLVINELLFNPESGGADFAELYNRSGKIFNLRGLALENQQKDSGDTLASFASDYLLFPQSYVVLSEAPAYILGRYSVQNPAALLESGLPTLDDKSGNLTLRMDGLVIDSFDYAESMHYTLLSSKEGVSLERLSPDAPTQAYGNWHSASSTTGFATPTYRNSQFIEQNSAVGRMIDIPNKTFSPDGDGFEDVLIINYDTGRPGYTLNVHIYDSQGRLVRRLANNETLAASGSLKWDGATADNGPARLGIYILWFELFTPDGPVEREKMAVVLAGRLE